MFARHRSRRLVVTLALVLTLVPVLAVVPVLPVAAAPLVTQSLAQGKTAQDLVTSLVGAGVTFSNVVYKGDNKAAGTVAGGTGVIGFEGGILLSSGNIADVVGPNNSTSKGTGLGTPGDANLNTLAAQGRQTLDAAILEFDFVPTANKIYFQYVFGSEEYNNYVDTSYNDVFGFFVNGTNCALVNGQPVSINTINRGKSGTDTSRPNANSFINNDKQDGTAPLNTQLDGLTVVLTCEANVTAGSTSHMKLAIGDTQDGSFDSAVFLKTASFSVTPPSASPSPNGPVCLTPGTLDFGNQIVGSNAPSQLAVLNNCGTQPLNPTLGSLGGTNAADFAIVSSCAGTTVAVGSSCGVRVTFTPAAAGPRSAFVTLNYSGGSVQLQLTGVGELPHPPFNLTVLTVGQCTVEVKANNQVDPAPYVYDVITPVTLTPTPAAGWTFVYWKSERGFMGWAEPWTFDMNKDHTVTAYCVPTPSFSDYKPSGATKQDPIIRLAALEVIRGYQADTCQDRGLTPPCFGPNDQVLRAQMAALISRGMGRDRAQTWDQEDHGNTFPDKGFVDDNLWRNVGTLYYYNVARGFQDGSYQPTGFVLYAQTISFITRAMVLNGYWLQKDDDTTVYPNVPGNSGHRTDIVTFVTQTNAPVPGTGAKTENWSIWNQNATRLWFSQAEWQALNSYFSVGSRFKP